MKSESSSFKLVAIGGGTGLSTLLTGLKPYLNVGQRANDTPQVASTNEQVPFQDKKVSLTAIVTVTDDGKSSGRLRSEFDVLPPGDLRNCLVALARDDRSIKSLFKHRFTGKGSLGGHSLGNLILVALTQMTGNFLEAVDKASDLLGCSARVLPSTLDSVDLEAQIGNQTAYGQRAIKALNALRGLPIENLKVTPPDAKALPEAIEAILNADVITLGPGSLFTSILPNLMINGITEAISNSKAKKIYICNIMTEADETDGLSAEEHLVLLMKNCPKLELDFAIFNSAPISSAIRELYAEEYAMKLEPPAKNHSDDGKIKFVLSPLAAEGRSVRHNPANLARAIFEIQYNGTS